MKKHTRATPANVPRSRAKSTRRQRRTSRVFWAALEQCGFVQDFFDAILTEDFGFTPVLDLEPIEVPVKRHSETVTLITKADFIAAADRCKP